MVVENTQFIKQQGHKGWVNSIEISSDGNSILSASNVSFLFFLFYYNFFLLIKEEVNSTTETFTVYIIKKTLTFNKICSAHVHD